MPERLPETNRSREVTLHRRAFLSATIPGGLLALAGAAGMGYYAFERAPFEPELVRISAQLPPAYEDLAGLRIGFVADTHLGPAMSEDDVDRALQLLAREQADLILLGGDYISASPRFAEPVAALLSELVDQAPLGGIAVLGNHDCGERGRERIVTDALEGRGIVVLRNQAAQVRTGRGDLWIAGIDEAIMARANPRATFAGIPADSAVISLWHEPDYAGQVSNTRAFLQLSGHSHGGQVRLPGLGPIFLPKGGERYVIGWNNANGLPVYTTRGVGVFLPPVRFACPPEVTLITLVAAE